VTTVADWLLQREPVPPDALLRRLLETLGVDAQREAAEAAEVCLAAGERLVGSVLEDDDASRDTALDLLAADAFVTYAFEASSAAPDELSRLATRAMTRMASLGGPASTGRHPSRT
jgi:hypothetical protein